MNPNYPAVAERAVHRCEYCHAPEVIFNFPFEVEHITPVVEGGSDDLSNLALSCRSCNIFKSVYSVGMDPETNREFGLYHPRRHTWEEHFRLDPEGRVEGISITGRVTVNRLRMNTPSQLSARLKWMKLDLMQ